MGGLGDFLLACPALQRLMAAGPVELLGRRERLQLGVDAGFAVKAHHMDDVGFDTLFTTPSDGLRAFLGRFSRVIVWMRDAVPLGQAIHACGVPEVHVFPGLPQEDWGGHASEYYLRCLGLNEGPSLQLNVAPAAEPHDVLVHPGSGGRHKNWPMMNFIKLEMELAKRARRVTWCLGPAEERFRVPAGARCVRPVSLSDAARELAAARVYVGNDSGITHLAAAVGCSTMALFGPTDPAVWAPRGGNVTVLRGEPWPEVEDVLAEVLRVAA